MEFEFDKEIDAILRKARGSGEVVTSFDSHMDADEISAFAENALTDAARQRYTAHLGDCTRCRKILSNVILLNGEAETETASSAVSAEIVETNVPWYRKLFGFPQIAYAMGALVVLFSGFFGYLILQNLPGAREVSYSANTTANKPAPQAAPTGFSSSNSNTAANMTATNSSVPMNAPSVANSAPLSPSNTTSSTTPAEKKSVETETDAPAIEAQPMATPEPKPMVKDEVADNKNPAITRNEAQTNQPSPAGAVREDNKRDKKENQSSIDGRSADDKLAEEKLKTQRSAPETVKKQPSKPGETRSVGGKTFNNVGGIWFDAAYTNQKQKTVRRGTSDYQKLDAGLRSIADQLGGTVVILWNGKAYRIQ
jgi:hypothetical protein